MMRNLLREHEVDLRIGLEDEDDAAREGAAASKLEFTDEDENDEETPSK